MEVTSKAKARADFETGREQPPCATDALQGVRPLVKEERGSEAAADMDSEEQAVHQQKLHAGTTSLPSQKKQARQEKSGASSWPGAQPVGLQSAGDLMVKIQVTGKVKARGDVDEWTEKLTAHDKAAGETGREQPTRIADALQGVRPLPEEERGSEAGATSLPSEKKQAGQEKSGASSWPGAQPGGLQSAGDRMVNMEVTRKVKARGDVDELTDEADTTYEKPIAEDEAAGETGREQPTRMADASQGIRPLSEEERGSEASADMDSGPGAQPGGLQSAGDLMVTALKTEAEESRESSGASPSSSITTEGQPQQDSVTTEGADEAADARSSVRASSLSSRIETEKPSPVFSVESTDEGGDQPVENAATAVAQQMHGKEPVRTTNLEVHGGAVPLGNGEADGLPDPENPPFMFPTVLPPSAGDNVKPAMLKLNQAWCCLVFGKMTEAEEIVAGMELIWIEPVLRPVMNKVLSLKAFIKGDIGELRFRVNEAEDCEVGPGVAVHVGWVYLHYALAFAAGRQQTDWLKKAEAMFLKDRDHMEEEAEFGIQVVAHVHSITANTRSIPLQVDPTPHHYDFDVLADTPTSLSDNHSYESSIPQQVDPPPRAEEHRYADTPLEEHYFDFDFDF